MPKATDDRAALVFKVQIPVSEIRLLPRPTDKKKVFWVEEVPPEATVRYLFYLTGVRSEDPAPQDSETRRKLFSLRFRSGCWLVVLIDATSLSVNDLLAARRAVIDQFWPHASIAELRDMRASLFSQPTESEDDCNGLIELCLTEAYPFS